MNISNQADMLLLPSPATWKIYYTYSYAKWIIAWAVSYAAQIINRPSRVKWIFVSDGLVIVKLKEWNLKDMSKLKFKKNIYVDR